MEAGRFLTAEDKKLLEQSYKNQREGKLVSSKQLRKELLQDVARGMKDTLDGKVTEV